MSQDAQSAAKPTYQQHLVQILDAGTSIVWLAESDPFRLLEINAAGQKYVGHPSDWNEGERGWLQAIHQDDRSRFEEALESALTRGAAQLRYRLADGSSEVTWLRDRISRIDIEGEAPLVGGIAVDITADEEEHQRLLESKAVLDNLIDDLPMNVVRKDLQGRIVFANQQFCDSIDRELDDLIGKSDFDLYPAELAQKYTDDDQRVIEQAVPFEDFEEHITGEGKRVYVQVLKAPVFDADGAAVGLQVMFWDATDRKEAELQLERERYLLHALMDGVSDSIYFKDKDSRFLRVSRGLAKKFGLASPQEAIGMSDADFFSPEHAQAALQDEVAVMRGGEPILGKEEKETWNAGEVTWCSTTKMALRDPAGQIVGTFGISRDITENKRAKAQLAQERDLLKTIIDNVPNLIFVKDRAGRFMLANAAVAKAFGVDSIDAVIGKTDYDFSEPEMACESVADDQIVMRSEEPLLDLETSLRGPEGSELCLLVSKVPLRNPEGKVVGLVGIGQDITIRKLAQEKLQEALAAAENANQAKSDFLANMSHEIRTPLNAVIGMTDLVLDTDLAPTQREFLSMIKESGSTLLRVINDVLDFSKIDAGKLELDPIDFDIREQIGNTMKSLAFRAHEKGLELAFRVHPDVPKALYGDVGRLRQITVNLVANALKFTEKGEVVVDVRSGPIRDNKANMQFEVRDTGIGIPKEKCDTIFEEFQQADTSTTRRYGGTGLGLAISTRLVELMGGRIWVTSQVGQGSTFHFSVPMDVADENGLAQTDRVVVGGTRVLIVDDNETNRLILDEMVRQWGMLPVQADSAEAAIMLLRNAALGDEPFRLVLSDVNMPEFDGYQLAEWIREEANLVNIPILMLTSGGRTGDRLRREELHIDAELAKPLKQSDLFDAIVRALGIRLAHRPNGPSSHKEKKRRPLNLLLAEDSKFNQKLALALLEKHGHTVTLAETGKEALELSGSRGFDLILMDVQMPEMDGLEATRLIRQREEESQTPRMPIVAMTAHAFKGDREQCLEAGMDDYISKPFDPHQLYEAIDSAMAQTSKTRTTPASHEAVEPIEVQQESQLVDFDRALERVGGSPDTLKLLAATLLGECPKLLDQIEEAIQSRNAKELQRAAHTMKGSALHFFAEPVAKAAAVLESLGIENGFDQATDALNELKVHAEKLNDSIRNRFQLSE